MRGLRRRARARARQAPSPSPFLFLQSLFSHYASKHAGSLTHLPAQLADELYPGSQPAVRGPALAAGGGTPTPRDAHTDAASADASDDGADEDLSVEEQIAREIAAIKRPRREHRFSGLNPARPT